MLLAKTVAVRIPNK